MKKGFFVILLSIVSVVLAPACNRAPTGRAKIAASTFPIFDLTRRVAGPDADVTLLLPTTAIDPSLRLGVLVGLGLDDAMEPKIKEANAKARLLKVGDRVPTLSDEGATDPHVWLDPQRARLIVKAIGEEMARADAGHANAYRKRAADVDASLEALDKELEQRTAAWKNRSFVAVEPSFGYFAERYKLTCAVKPQSTDPAARALDAIGGTAETNGYEELLRYDVSQMEKQQH